MQLCGRLPVTPRRRAGYHQSLGSDSSDPRRHVGWFGLSKGQDVSGASGGEARRDRIVGVEHGGLSVPVVGTPLQQFQQPPFGRSVASQRSVNVQVLMSHVGNHGPVERKAVHASQFQRVRRHLDHRPGIAASNHPSEQAGHAGSFGCGESTSLVQIEAAGPCVDRRELADAAHIRSQHPRDQACGAGLTVRAGHANQTQPAVRLAPEPASQAGQRHSTVRYKRQANAGRRRDQAFGNDCRGPRGHGGWDVGMPVNPQTTTADEAASGFDVPRIVGDISNLSAGRPHQLRFGQARDQRIKCRRHVETPQLCGRPRRRCSAARARNTPEVNAQARTRCSGKSYVRG